jgi:predicted membrane-bound dolichyl-phosphate-mannose-protein mannosyltransferase
MERSLISWNLPNWITIGLMAAAWVVVLAVAKKIVGAPITGAQTGGF